jgi:hypothetical protein
LLRLQRIVIGDARFVRLGLRQEGGSVGEHDRENRTPIPDHISAKPEDLPTLVEGIVAFDRGAEGKMDAVIAAAVLAFRLCLHPPLRGRERTHSSLPDASRIGSARVQPARNPFPGVRGNLATDR